MGGELGDGFGLEGLYRILLGLRLGDRVSLGVRGCC